MFFRDTGVAKHLPVKLCNAIIFNSLVSIHFVSLLLTIPEKEVKKQLCQSFAHKKLKTKELKTKSVF